MTELLVVVIIVGILASLVIPNYSLTRQKTMDKEAIAALKLVGVAEKQYFSKYGFYYCFDCGGGFVSDLNAINMNLNLALGSLNWVILVQGGMATFLAIADELRPPYRRWVIDQTTTEPGCIENCG